MNKIWKDVPSYEGSYQVSTCGLIRSVERLVKYTEKHSGLRKSKVLNTRLNKDGYIYTIVSVNKERKTVKAHRLVALTFIPNPENKLCVNHINGIKSDNRVENLEWCTHSENTNHAVRMKLKVGVKGEKSHLSKLKNEDILKIKSLYNEGSYSQAALGKIFNVSQSQIYRIIKGINWNT